MVFSAGIIGLGRIGALLEEDKLRVKPATHIGAYYSNPEVKVIACSEINKKLLHAVKQKWKFEQAYTDYRVMLEKNEFDIVSVCTNVDSHHKIVLDIAKISARRSKRPIIFCEKPIANTIKEAREMVNICKQNQIKLAINHTRRWHPNYELLAKVIKSQRYGFALHGIGLFSGDIINDGVHMADLYNWYCRVNSRKIQFVPVLTKGNFLTFELDLIFERGRLRMINNGNELQAFHSTPSRNYRNFKELETVQIEIHGMKALSAFRLAVEDLVLCIKDEKREPKCTGEHGLQALETAVLWKKWLSLSKL